MKSWLSAALLGVAWAGSLTSATYAALVVVAAVRFHRRRTRALSQPAVFAPPISVLKPLHGAEPELENNLRGFFTQTYSGEYELLFCARHETDAGLRIAQKLAAEYPSVATRLFCCGEPQLPNPKMYSLAIMAEAARSDILITSDADARVAPNHLAALVQELRDDKVDIAFSLYVGQADRPRLFLHLDALGKSVEMNAGVLAASLLSPTDFTLGVTVIQRRDVFARAGGFADLGSYWAEDFVLGNRIARAGGGVRISTHVVGLVVSAASAKQSFQNQLRWSQSTRRSRPLGHLGTGLTFAMPFALLGSVVELARGRWPAAGIFLLAAFAQRAILGGAVLHALGAAHRLRDSLLYPLRDLYGFVIWLASYLPADTRYHGTQFRIMRDGRLLPPASPS